jgi:hypothetical protein
LLKELFMPAVIAIEAKPVEFEGLDSGFLHIYLVKTVTDEQGRVVSEKVIRGNEPGSGGDLETLVDANLATSPDRRGSDTPEERHRKVLDLGTRDANDIWQIMVQHANNIGKANLKYSVDIFKEISGEDLNSNSIVASVLHAGGLSWTASLPIDINRSDVGTTRSTAIWATTRYPVRAAMIASMAAQEMITCTEARATTGSTEAGA